MGWIDSVRFRRAIAVVAAGLTFLLVATIPWSLSGGVFDRPGIDHASVGRSATAVVVPLAFTVSGLALIWLRPRNVIGWILITVGVLQAVQQSLDSYAARALTDPDRSLPFGLFAAWGSSWTWIPAVLLPITVLPALYPTGRTTSPFWRWEVRLALAGIVLVCLMTATTQGTISDTVSAARLPWETPTWLVALIGIPALALLAGTVVMSLVGTVVRTTRAQSPERQQLAWLVTVVGAMVPLAFYTSGPLFSVVYVAVPVAVTIGVLRYGLLGIEVLVRRTLLYVPLTLLVAFLGGGLATWLARLIPSGPLPLIFGSAVVAIVIFPLAAWLRRSVDRFVMGERADPLAVVDRVGSGLELSAEDPVPAMLEAVASSVGASYAAVSDEVDTVVAAVGEPTASSLALPLLHGGERLGTLTVGPRRGEPRVTDRDRQLVDALAPHVAVVLASRRLTDELARERQRVVAATLAERERLRSDLHDGLGPSLSGIALGLEAADHLLTSDPATAHDLLARTRQEAESAVLEVRRVLDALRPSALDRQGLPDAVREAAVGLGLGRAGSSTSFSLDLQTELPPLRPAVEEAAYRIVTEALTNVARHAQASHCSVALFGVNGDLRVVVRDDGRGFDGPRQGGVGLPSMRRRAEDLGGSLAVWRSEPCGTVVEVELPLGAQ
jgi:signal transduction histidine kinase